MTKRVLVLWSGGLDSTYLIYKYLSEGHTVWATNVEVKNNYNLNREEELARRNLSPIFQQRFGERFHNLGSVGSVMLTSHNPNIIFPQASFFPLVLHALPADLDELAIGYMATDPLEAPGTGGLANVVRTMLEGCKGIVHGSKWEVVFPLLRMSKQEIRTQLPGEYRGLVYSSPTAFSVGSMKASGMQY